MFNKKADGGLTAIIIIIIALVFLGWLVNLGSRQCSSNGDCKSDQYCGSDFSCHKMQVIEKETTIIQRNYGGIVWAIALTVIIIVLITNLDKIITAIRNGKRDNRSNGNGKTNKKDPVYSNYPVYYEETSK